MDKTQTATSQQIATFAAGCFWGVEDLFRNIEGVTSTMVGYSGGHAENPTYKEVCNGKTGHAEAVQVEFDPSIVSYEDLVNAFWDGHDPTTYHRQGPDIGEQYRSMIFYHSPEQQEAAQKSKQDLDNTEKYKNPIVTEIVPASEFYKAEEYHQQYLSKRGMGTCHV